MFYPNQDLYGAQSADRKREKLEPAADFELICTSNPYLNMQAIYEEEVRLALE
jgi:hypothetical protein